MPSVFAPGCALLIYQPELWHTELDRFIEAH